MSNHSKAKDVVLFRLSTENRTGMISASTDALRGERITIINANARVVSDQEGVIEYTVEDETENHGFQTLLGACRSLQSINGCNHLLAEFARLISSGKGSVEPSLIHSGVTPFESYFSGQLLNEHDPLHPANVSASDFEPVIYELDNVAAEFISDPDRIISVKPSDLERIIGEVYRAHGLDVRITGGSNDHGIDASATAYVPVKLPRKYSQHLRIAIQVKRYQRNRKVRESEVRNLYGSLSAEGYDRGVLVTTSSLTAAAEKYLGTRRAIKDRITVIAGDEVLELLISYCKQRWVPFWR